MIYKNDCNYGFPLEDFVGILCSDWDKNVGPKLKFFSQDTNGHVFPWKNIRDYCDPYRQDLFEDF